MSNYPNYLSKNYLKILQDYEEVKAGRSQYFRTCTELYNFYHTSAKQVLKYRSRYLASGGKAESLLPKRRGPKEGTNRTPKDIERNVISAYRRLGYNRYELVNLFTPVYKHQTPRASTMYLIVKRYQRGLRKKEIEVIKRYEKSYPGELGHIDSYYLPQSTTKPFGLKKGGRGYLCAITDDCTRLVYSEVLTNLKSETVAGFLGRSLSFFYRNYGLRFKIIMTDNGAEYRGKEFKFLLNYLGIKQTFIAPYHPQTNGKIEAFWKIINREFLYPNRFATLKDLVYNLGEYIYQYNHTRRHGGLNYITPWTKFLQVNQHFTEILD